MSLPATSPVSHSHHLNRPRAEFAPAIWGDFFLRYASQSMEVDENVKHQVEVLKEDVKKMLESPINQNVTQKLNLIDSVQRLGLSYHFEREIDEALAQFHNSFTKDNAIKEDADLQFCALLFRLLRQQGYLISSEIFNKFKDKKGNFEEKLGNDVQGLLKLYEATQVRVHGEHILDEAEDFAYCHLKSLSNTLNSSVAAKINHYLKLPFHRREPRSEAKYYITLYEEDPFHNESLLTFAKLDFNNRQKMHQKELSDINQWCKKLDYVGKVPYARDRFVGCYFWGLAMCDEPEFSIARKTVGKMTAICTLVDDTFDAYGTIQELELFTQAFRNWDKNPCQSLPDSMKVVFDAFLQFSNEMDLLMLEAGKPNMIQYFKQSVYELAESYLVEKRWCDKRYIPKYEEYKNNGVVTSAFPLIIITFISMAKFANKQLLQWISSKPKIIRAASLICRLMDDMGSHKFEQEREHVASAVECCMMQYGISVEEAYKFIREDVANYWKEVNEECLKLLSESNNNNTKIPKKVLDCIINMARIIEFMYEDNVDKFTDEHLLKDHILSLIVQPITMTIN